MKIIDTNNLPRPIVEAIRAGVWDREQAVKHTSYSVTQLLDAPRRVHLRDRHYNEMEVEASDRLWALFGNAMHYVLETGVPDDIGKVVLKEHRLSADVLGRAISGQCDLYVDGVLYDFKETSTWTLIYHSRDLDWTHQLNFYAWLLRQHDYPVREAHIIARLRDWSKSKAARESKYPKSQVKAMQIPLYDAGQVDRMVHDRVQALIDCEKLPDDKLPECSPDDRWMRNTTYAVMHPKKKRALAVKDTEKLATDWLINYADKGCWVEKRPGKNVRCEEYCQLKPWCSQWHKLKQQPDVEKIVCK